MKDPIRGRFGGAREAVSEVVGVTMLIAIAVALSVAVFVAVRILADYQATEQPMFGMVDADADDQIVVVSGSGDSSWGQLELSTNKPLRFALGGPAGPLSPQLAPGSWATAGAALDEIGGGDYLEFCGDGAPQTGVNITLRYAGSAGDSQLLRQVTFADVAPCA